MRFAAIIPALFATAAVAADATWLTDLEAAKAKSAETGKPILMDFTGSDWCGWCIKLKDEVFKTPEFATWAESKVVLLEVDFPARKEQPDEVKAQNEQLQQQYKIEGYPTIVITDATGKELGRLGYERGGPAVWTKSADKVVSR